MELMRVKAEQDAREKRTSERTYALTESGLIEEMYAELGEEQPVEAASKQLGVRLRPEQWERLRLVATWNGVRTTTMARMLINRAARAIIEDELKHRRAFGLEGE